MEEELTQIVRRSREANIYSDRHPRKTGAWCWLAQGTLHTGARGEMVVVRKEGGECVSRGRLGSDAELDNQVNTNMRCDISELDHDATKKSEIR